MEPGLITTTTAEHYVHQLRRAYAGLTAGARPAVVAAAAAVLVTAELAEVALSRPGADRRSLLARARDIAVRRADEAARGFVGGPLEKLELCAAARAVRGAVWGLCQLAGPGASVHRSQVDPGASR